MRLLNTFILVRVQRYVSTELAAGREPLPLFYVCFCFCGSGVDLWLSCFLFEVRVCADRTDLFSVVTAPHVNPCFSQPKQTFGRFIFCREHISRQYVRSLADDAMPFSLLLVRRRCLLAAIDSRGVAARSSEYQVCICACLLWSLAVVCNNTWVAPCRSSTMLQCARTFFDSLAGLCYYYHTLPTVPVPCVSAFFPLRSAASTFLGHVF